MEILKILLTSLIILCIILSSMIIFFRAEDRECQKFEEGLKISDRIDSKRLKAEFIMLDQITTT